MGRTAFPTANGYSNLPNGYFIPEVWSANFLKNYYESALYPSIMNTDYEGEIQSVGSKVIIPRDPEITVNDYIMGQGLDVQVVTDDGVEFPITRGAYYAFGVKDLERKQTDKKWIAKATNNASDQTKIKIDKAVLGELYASCPSANILSDSLSVTKDTIDKLVIDFGVYMDNNAVPEDSDRWLILPYELIGLVKLNPNLNDASKMGDDKSMLRNGIVGSLDRMTIYGSSRLTKYADGSFQVLAGHRQAATFATQLTVTETLRNQNEFGDIVRGLQVYDWKVTQPKMLFTRKVKAV